MTKEELYTEILQAKKFFTGKGFKEQLSHLLHKYDSSQNKEEVEETEPFDIEKWTLETVVKQKQGKTVRILCTDLDDAYPIVGAVENESGELVIDKWCIDGRYDQSGRHERDLVMVKPEPKTETIHIFRDLRGMLHISSKRIAPLGTWIKTVELPL